MSSRVYSAYNGALVTTASPVPVTTSTSIKTLQQLATSSTMSLEVVEWGISFDGSAAATPGICELVDTVERRTLWARVCAQHDAWAATGAG